MSDEVASPGKKRRKRRPVWVLIPVEYEHTEIVHGLGGAPEYEKVHPRKYVVVKCEGGKGQTDAIRAALVKHEIDPSNFDDVLMFRAEPLDFEISQQLIIRI